MRELDPKGLLQPDIQVAPHIISIHCCLFLSMVVCRLLLELDSVMFIADL